MILLLLLPAVPGALPADTLSATDREIYGVVMDTILSPRREGAKTILRRVSVCSYVRPGNNLFSDIDRAFLARFSREQCRRVSFDGAMQAGLAGDIIIVDNDELAGPEDICARTHSECIYAKKYHCIFEKYPGTRRICALSPVTYNEGRSQALVFYSVTAGPLNSRDLVVWLSRDAGRWSVKGYAALNGY